MVGPEGESGVAEAIGGDSVDTIRVGVMTTDVDSRSGCGVVLSTTGDLLLAVSVDSTPDDDREGVESGSLAGTDVVVCSVIDVLASQAESIINNKSAIKP
jgi:hypothetical protein